VGRVLNVYNLPDQVTPEELTGGTVVVIDVLRAATTITHALAAGAVEVIPCLEIDDARRIAEQLPAGRYVTGGERGGLPIPGFDLGNSPTHYTPERVGGRTVVFTTTNGTRTMLRCRLARRVFIGAFVNARAIVRELAGSERICVICSGSGGQISRDDILFAGLVVERLVAQGDAGYQLNPQAQAARADWRTSFPDGLPTAEQLAAQLRDTIAGRKVIAIGLEGDILEVARIDKFDIVPVLDLATMRIQSL
jgi:2-phosphosulfolactate phosphatase